MKLLPATILLISISVVVFIVMAIQLNEIFNFNYADLITMGANLDALVGKGEWWRLISSLFIHGGMLHLLVNMVSLYLIGKQFEPVFGSMMMLLIYFFSGVAASICSIYMNIFSVSCGASGAIFGMAGASFVMFLTNRDKSSKDRFNDFLPFIYFIFINAFLAYRFNFIDKYAHAGGLLTGMFIGIIWSFVSLKVHSFFKRNIIFVFTSAIFIASFYFSIDSLPKYRYAYFQMFQNFIKNDETTLDILNQDFTEKQSSRANIYEAEQIWNKNISMLNQFSDVPEDLIIDINTLRQYINIRKMSLKYFSNYIESNDIAYEDSVGISLALLNTLPPLKYKIGYGHKTVNEELILNKDIEFTEYYDNNWNLTSKAFASYYRIGKRDSIGNVKGIVNDFYLDGRIQMKSGYFNNSQSGSAFYYFHDGKYQSYGKYFMDRRVGIWKYFYENGQLHSIVDFKDGIRYQIAYFDKSGNVMVMGGNGFYKDFYDSGQLFESGFFKDGLKDGLWQGFYENSNIYYKEYYELGSLKVGKSIDRTGISRTYKQEWQGFYPLGLDSNQTYNDYISANLKYPAEAMIQKIEGTVVVEFFVDSTGRITNVKNINKIGYGCEEEAVRLIKDGPEFFPALHRGIKTGYTDRINIVFKL